MCHDAPRCQPSPCPIGLRGFHNSMPASDALLLIATGCPHCQGMLEGVLPLVKSGIVGRLEVVNSAVSPAQAEALGVKSVPWCRMGPFALEGVVPAAILQSLARHGDTPKGWAIYFDLLFTRGARVRVEALVREDPRRLEAFPLLLGDPEVETHARLGVGAVLEELHGSGLAAVLTPALGELSRHPDPRLRGDACYYLSLTESPDALPFLRNACRDENTQVREIAEEALEDMQQIGTGDK